MISRYDMVIQKTKRHKDSEVVCWRIGPENLEYGGHTGQLLNVINPLAEGFYRMAKLRFPYCTSRSFALLVVRRRVNELPKRSMD